jgi:hypothetical protein
VNTRFGRVVLGVDHHERLGDRARLARPATTVGARQPEPAFREALDRLFVTPQCRGLGSQHLLLELESPASSTTQALRDLVVDGAEVLPTPVHHDSERGECLGRTPMQVQDAPVDREIPVDREAAVDREVPTNRGAPADRDVVVDPEAGGVIGRGVIGRDVGSGASRR